MCAAAKNKCRRMIWQPIDIKLSLFLSCLVEMLVENTCFLQHIIWGYLEHAEAIFSVPQCVVLLTRPFSAAI